MLVGETVTDGVAELYDGIVTEHEVELKEPVLSTIRKLADTVPELEYVAVSELL